MLLILKLTIVPLFIGLITLAGRKWGPSVAGLLGAFPVVAGPIIIFIAYEQGSTFAAATAVAATSATACLLIFGLVYSWACIRLNWFVAFLLSFCAWLAVAFLLAIATPDLLASVVLSTVMLIAMPYLLPSIKADNSPRAKLHDLPLRMLVGAGLTLAVTTIAATVGDVWSGILAVFPVIGSVLAIFTHTTMGPAQVTQIYRGMVTGFYSFEVFFIGMALLLTHTSIWVSCLVSISMAIGIQLIIQLIIKKRRLANV